MLHNFMLLLYAAEVEKQLDRQLLASSGSKTHYNDQV